VTRGRRGEVPEAPSEAPVSRSTTAPASGSIAVGVLSDTHGHLYGRVAQLLEGADQIVHAGDLGSQEVLRSLRSIAPVVAVRGNCDLDPWAAALPLRAELELGGVRIVVGHMVSMAERGRLQLESGKRPVVVVSGHSHIASLEQHDAFVQLNPGSAGPRRFGRPRTIARLEIWPPPAGEPGGLPRVTAQLLSAED
jgi:uncharacterized protein